VCGWWFSGSQQSEKFWHILCPKSESENIYVQSSRCSDVQSSRCLDIQNSIDFLPSLRVPEARRADWSEDAPLCVPSIALNTWSNLLLVVVRIITVGNCD
jgi:hypothetical protein